MIERIISPDILTIEDAETQVKQVVQQGYLQGLPRAVLEQRVEKIIKTAVDKIQLPSLRNATYKSLTDLARRELNKFVRIFGHKGVAVMAALVLAKAGKLSADKAPTDGTLARVIAEKFSKSGVTYESVQFGIPAQIYSKEYMQAVKKQILSFSQEQGLNTEADTAARYTLRAKAEMEVRYNAQQSNLEELKGRGVKLVVSSVHADCSDRCAPYQGRVYSLDGTTGVTKDGRKYVPIETATDIFYTTKQGKTYKNGLLGFNCRHYLYPYKDGMAIPYVSRDKQEKERKVTQRQREFESRVRLYRENALRLEQIAPKDAAYWKRKAIREYRVYKTYSHVNGRAYYPDRVKILI